MRYFCFTFKITVKNGYLEGNYYHADLTFPSSIYLEKNILEKFNKEKEGELIILNIFEFKNKEDYNNFINN